MSLSLIVVFVVFPALMAFAAASDLLTMTISNRLCLALIAAFAVCAIMIGLPLADLGWHLAAGGVVLLVSFGLFAAGWIGGGDAKLVAATALWFGFDELVVYLCFAAIGGGVLTFLILKLRSAPLPPVFNWAWLHRLHAPTSGVPYGIALALAALFVLPETAIWRAALGI